MMMMMIGSNVVDLEFFFMYTKDNRMSRQKSLDDDNVNLLIVTDKY